MSSLAPSGYIGVPIITDPGVLRDAILNYLVQNIDGLRIDEADLPTFLAAGVARVVAEARDVASAVPIAIFRTYGRSLLGLPPVAAAFASMPSTWTMVDNKGYTIRAGTVVAYQATGNQQILFRTNTDVTIPVGATSAANVDLVAVTAGAAANGIPNGSAIKLIDSLAFVTSIVTSADSSSGADAESDITYLNRLSQLLTTLAPRPILPADFSILATQVPGVDRALTLDGYNPLDSTSGNERMVTVVGLDVNGAALSSGAKTALQTYLVDRREINFVVHIGDPTFTAVNVVFQAVADVGADPAAVRVAAVAAVTAFINPATFAGGAKQPPTWDAGESSIGRLDVAAVIGAVPGVHHVTLLTINGVAADLALAGYAPLPSVGTVTGTVT